jgi:hypothetical protein
MTGWCRRGCYIRRYTPALGYAIPLALDRGPLLVREALRGYQKEEKSPQPLARTDCGRVLGEQRAPHDDERLQRILR